MKSSLWLRADSGVQRHTYGTDSCRYQKLTDGWFLLPYPAPRQWRSASNDAHQNGLWLNSWLNLGQAVCNSQLGRDTGAWWRKEKLVYQGIQTTAASVQYVAMTGDIGGLWRIPPFARTDIAIVTVLPKTTLVGASTEGTYEAAQRLAHWAAFTAREVRRVQWNCPEPGDYPEPRHIIHAGSYTEQAMVRSALERHPHQGEIKASRRRAGPSALVARLRKPKRGQRVVFLVADPRDRRYAERLTWLIKQDLGLDVVHVSVCSKFDRDLDLRLRGLRDSRPFSMKSRIDEAYPQVG